MGCPSRRSVPLSRPSVSPCRIRFMEEINSFCLEFSKFLRLSKICSVCNLQRKLSLWNYKAKFPINSVMGCNDRNFAKITVLKFYLIILMFACVVVFQKAQIVHIEYFSKSQMKNILTSFVKKNFWGFSFIQFSRSLARIFVWTIEELEVKSVLSWFSFITEPASECVCVGEVGGRVVIGAPPPPRPGGGAD